MNDPARQVREGPWLDRLFPIHLPGGRMFSVLAFSVLPTNAGILEGGLTPEMNIRQRERIVALAEQRYGNPVVAVEPTVLPLPEFSTPSRVRERYPWMACIARLTSTPLDPEICSAAFTLVWWQDSFHAALPEEIERAAASVDWERSAVDVDLP